MKHINLILGCHGHQPVGNFDFVIEDAYEKSYRPFIDVLEQFPAVRVTLHYTGPLWDWFLKHRPDYVARLALLARSGQVEIMGGGYYEPLLCAIPERDAIAQIQRMQSFCQEHLGLMPRGMWLTERVWEPHMAKVLAQAGVEYAALDDTHFLCSGLPAESLYGYYMTEEEGETLKIFPIQEKLRYLVPFHPVAHTIDYLRELATEAGERCAVLHDDTEKFGVWPGTFESVYEEGWLVDFFQTLTDQQSWLHSVTYSEYLDSQPPLGRTYITCASYQEMMAWALPTERQRELKEAREALARHEELWAQCSPFMRGGFWRNFLSKYPEANSMQKRMLLVSKRLQRLERHAGTPDYEEACLHLHQGQCNCAYWHGQFGGLYLNHLRSAIYEQLNRADSALDRLDPPELPIRLNTGDFDGDGEPEYLLENSLLSLYVSPHDGGTIYEMDYKPGHMNLLNTLARREEPYHDQLKEERPAGQNEGVHSIHEPFQAKEDGLDGLLFQDGWRRASLRDHFYAHDTSPEDLYRNQAIELVDLPLARYAVSPQSTALELSVSAPLPGHESGELHVRKRIELVADESEVKITYDIASTSKAVISGLFCPEFAINLLTGSAPDRYYRSDDGDLKKIMLGACTTFSGLHHLALCDEWQQIDTGFRASEAVDFRVFPLETVSQSESGQERVYQGSVVFPCWAVKLSPGASVVCELTWYVKRFFVAEESDK